MFDTEKHTCQVKVHRNKSLNLISLTVKFMKLTYMLQFWKIKLKNCVLGSVSLETRRK